MGSALARGLLQAGAVTPERLLCADPQHHRFADAARAADIQLTQSNTEVAEFGTIVVLAVKPHNVEPVLEEIEDFVHKDQLILSIAAGVRTGDIEDMLADGVPVVRAMPNSCAQVNAGACAIAAGRYAGEEHLQTAAAVFSAVGTVLTVPEGMMDAVTALSGSGPAYVYLMIEALVDGGVKVGLPREVAYRLAVQTVLGAATMARDTGRHPAELKDIVATPSGTTISALASLEQSGFRSAVMTAVEKAAERSRELGDK